MIERLSRDLSAKRLKLIIPQVGIEVKKYSLMAPTAVDTVYGNFAGSSIDESSAVPIKVLITSFQFRLMVDGDGSWLEDVGYLFTLDSLAAGDVISVLREDGVSIKFKVLNPESLGLTTKVVTRFKITNLAGTQ